LRPLSVMDIDICASRKWFIIFGGHCVCVNKCRLHFSFVVIKRTQSMVLCEFICDRFQLVRKFGAKSIVFIIARVEMY
jgi:hypothetical protein